MSTSEHNLPPEDSTPAKPPRSEAELLEHESQLARGAVQRLRHEIMQSLRRSADVKAWAVRFPWPTLGAAAVAGIGAGWAIGSATRRGTASDQSLDESAADPSTIRPEAEAAAHPTGRLVSGLGTLAGAVMSAAIGAATQAVSEVVKETIHDSLHPETGDPEEPVADSGQ